MSKDELNTLQTAKQIIYYTTCLFKLTVYVKETAPIYTVILALTSLRCCPGRTPVPNPLPLISAMAKPEVSYSSPLLFSTRRSDLVAAAAWFLFTISLACSTSTAER